MRKSSRRGCVGQACRREKHRKGLKKPGGGVRGTLRNADQNVIFATIVRGTPRAARFLCFPEELRRCGRFFSGGAASRKAADWAAGGEGCGSPPAVAAWGQARRREKHRKGLKKPGGACGVRKSSRRGCVGASLPQEHRRAELKKTAKAGFFCFLEKSAAKLPRRGGGFFPGGAASRKAAAG